MTGHNSGIKYQKIQNTVKKKKSQKYLQACIIDYLRMVTNTGFVIVFSGNAAYKQLDTNSKCNVIFAKSIIWLSFCYYKNTAKIPELTVPLTHSN